MTKALAILELNWWPVGQGLFASGRLTDVAGREFLWVYDCGTASAHTFLTNAISNFHSKNPKRSIDLVALSHFDADHINGIVALTAAMPVRMLLLPFVPLWQRLVIALENGLSTGDPLFSFYLDPVGYLSEATGGRIEEIIFVPSAGRDETSREGGGEPAPDTPIDSATVEAEPGDDIVRGVRVRYLRPGGRITVPALWEFVPYNDNVMLPCMNAKFQKRAETLARNFASYPCRRAVTLTLLKRLFDRTFGHSALARNVVSLFLYSGPIRRSSRLAWIHANAPIGFNSQADNFAQLHTGDAYLNTAARLTELQRFYGRRMARAGIFQVMHHGARRNWYSGIASVLRPAISIFSSDPANTRLGHPHAEVLRDFSPWHPVQVDLVNGFRFSGLLLL